MDETADTHQEKPPPTSLVGSGDSCAGCVVSATVYELKGAYKSRRYAEEPLSAAEIHGLRQVMITCPVARRILADMSAKQQGE